MHWWTPRRVRICLYGGIGLVSGTWVACYVIWLAEGCTPFLPFVSDFGGGPTGPLFAVGMTAGSLLLLPTWCDFYLMMRPEFHAASATWRCLHRCLPFMGAWCSLSIAGVALDPWDLRLQWHVFFADGIFFGGIIFALVASLLGRQRGRPHRGPLTVVAIAFAAVVLMTGFVTQGVAEVGKEGLKSSMVLMRDEYAAYCKGMGPSWHRNANVNIAALFEWILLGSVTALVFTMLRNDLRGWAPSIVSELTPPLASRASDAGGGESCWSEPGTRAEAGAVAEA